MSFHDDDPTVFNSIALLRPIVGRRRVASRALNKSLDALALPPND
jgi:hypothetical protein